MSVDACISIPNNFEHLLTPSHFLIVGKYSKIVREGNVEFTIYCLTYIMIDGNTKGPDLILQWMPALSIYVDSRFQYRNCILEILDFRVF